MAEDKYTNFEDYEKWHANHKNDKAPSKTNNIFAKGIIKPI